MRLSVDEGGSSVTAVEPITQWRRFNSFFYRCTPGETLTET
jgi:hypothetical protein